MAKTTLPRFIVVLPSEDKLWLAGVVPAGSTLEAAVISEHDYVVGGDPTVLDESVYLHEVNDGLAVFLVPDDVLPGDDLSSLDYTATYEDGPLSAYADWSFVGAIVAEPEEEDHDAMRSMLEDLETDRYDD